MVTAYLQFKDTARAIDWYQTVLGAKETRKRLVTPEGTCMNAEVEIGGSRLMLADEMPSIGSKSPLNLGGTSVVLNLHVNDVDQVFQLAIRSGAEQIFEVADQFYGDRAGRICDPFGHHWIIATRVRNVPEDEMAEAFRTMFR